MGTKPSIFQPGHDGKHRQVPVTPPMTVSHINHNTGRQIEHDRNAAKGAEQAVRTDRKNAGPIDPRVGGKPKHTQITPVHGGMVRVTNGKAITGGGHAASALDSLSGQVVVPGCVTAQPGFGNGGVQSGHPLAKAPAGKNLKPVPPSFGMSRGAKGDHDLAALGSAILDEAFSNADAATRAAHGRK